MMQLVVNDLNMDAYVDMKALSDAARFYYSTAHLDKTLVRKTNGNNISTLSYLNQVKKLNAKSRLLQKLKIRRKKRTLKFKNNSAKNATTSKINRSTTQIPTPTVYIMCEKHYIYHKIYQYCITDIAREVNFLNVIKDYEGIKVYEESEIGVKLKTNDKNSYQFFYDTHILYDFKNDNKSFTLLAYIKNYHNCNSYEALIHISKYIDIEPYMSINPQWQDAIRESLDNALNYKDFQNNLIEKMDFQQISIHKENENILIISGNKYDISEFKLQEYRHKWDIIDIFKKNRKKDIKTILYKRNGSAPRNLEKIL